jgi:hypothetical protein
MGIPSENISVLGFLPPLSTVSKFLRNSNCWSHRWPIKVEVNPSEVKTLFFLYLLIGCQIIAIGKSMKSTFRQRGQLQRSIIYCLKGNTFGESLPGSPEFFLIG